MASDDFSDKQKLIGAVVLRFANVEAMIDGLIRMQYVRDVETGYDFLLDVLADEGFSFALRCNVLRKVLLRNGQTEKEAATDVQLLRSLGNIRNQLAHIGKAAVVGETAGYLHPRKPGEVINESDIEATFERFEADCATAEAFLIGWLTRLSPYQQALRAEASKGSELATGPADEPTKDG
jgi:hypothetical protein